MVLHDSTSLEYDQCPYGRHCHLITWVCGFSIKDSVHLDCFLRKRKRRLQAQPYTPPPRRGCSSLQPRFLTQGLPDMYLFSRHCARCSGHIGEQGRAGYRPPKACNQAGAIDKEALQFTVIKPMMGEYRMLWGRGGTGVGKGHLMQTWGVGKHPE